MVSLLLPIPPSISGQPCSLSHDWKFIHASQGTAGMWSGEDDCQPHQPHQPYLILSAPLCLWFQLSCFCHVGQPHLDSEGMGMRGEQPRCHSRQSFWRNLGLTPSVSSHPTLCDDYSLVLICKGARVFISLFNWIWLSVPVTELMWMSESLRGDLLAVGKDRRPGPQAPRLCLCFSFGMVLGSYRQNRVYFMWRVSNMSRILGD